MTRRATRPFGLCLSIAARAQIHDFNALIYLDLKIASEIAWEIVRDLSRVERISPIGGGGDARVTVSVSRVCAESQTQSLVGPTSRPVVGRAGARGTSVIDVVARGSWSVGSCAVDRWLPCKRGQARAAGAGRGAVSRLSAFYCITSCT